MASAHSKQWWIDRLVESGVTPDQTNGLKLKELKAMAEARNLPKPGPQLYFTASAAKKPTDEAPIIKAGLAGPQAFNNFKTTDPFAYIRQGLPAPAALSPVPGGAPRPPAPRASTRPVVGKAPPKRLVEAPAEDLEIVDQHYSVTLRPGKIIINRTPVF